jgi:1-acyl-sn-glycerol-3-phosphate acyltransferase
MGAASGRIPPFHWWRTVFFLIPFVSLYSVACGACSLASSVVDRRGDTAHWFARAWAWLILATTGVRVEAEGRERLTPGQSYVFVGNHNSYYDIPILFWWLPFQLRIIAKDSLGRFPIWGWHLSRTGHILVNRRNPGSATLKRVSGLMRQGASLVVFPEGTRSLDGTVGRFKGGIFLLAIQAGLPIVPVSLSGTRAIMPKNRLMTCPATVRLVVHDPIPTAGLPLEAAKTLARDVQRTVASVVAQHPEPGQAARAEVQVARG